MLVVIMFECHKILFYENDESFAPNGNVIFLVLD